MMNARSEEKSSHLKNLVSSLDVVAAGHTRPFPKHHNAANFEGGFVQWNAVDSETSEGILTAKTLRSGRFFQILLSLFYRVTTEEGHTFTGPSLQC